MAEREAPTVTNEMVDVLSNAALGGHRATVRPTYKVRTVRWAGGLELHIDGVGVTQTHGDHPGDTAEAMASDYISAVLEVASDSFDVVIISSGQHGPTVDLGQDY